MSTESGSRPPYLIGPQHDCSRQVLLYHIIMPLVNPPARQSPAPAVISVTLHRKPHTHVDISPPVGYTCLCRQVQTISEHREGQV